MTQHTPGPWLIEEDDPNASSREIQEANEARSCIAGVSKWTRGGAERIAAAEANARLIAAAPDLLEALRGVEWGCEVDAAEGGFIAGCPSCGAERRTGEHHQDCQLNAALTKAEGRT